MSEIKCFLLQPLGRDRLWFRRYEAGPCGDGGEHSYHNAKILLGDYDAPEANLLRRDPPFGHERWPDRCEKCGHAFSDKAARQLFPSPLYMRASGEIMTLQEAPVGAMWHAPWYEGIPSLVGPDGKALIVRVPENHDWQVDGRASNCDSPCKNCGVAYKDHNKAKLCQKYEDANPHKCWIRHGEAPLITVDKRGNTCNAGAGSIMTDEWHGFLTNGVLKPC
jgi:hypothetical protein